MSVIIHRTRGQGFSMLPNDLLRDDRMSLKARGLLVTLLSHEDGWQQSIAYAQKECKDGKDAIWSGLRELEALGYLYREKRQTSSGRWRWDHHVYDTPEQAHLPGTDNPYTVKPRTEIAGIEVEALDIEPLAEEPLGEVHIATRKRDALFEAVAEACGIDWQGLTSSARGSLNKAVAQLRGVNATPDEVYRRGSLWPYDVPLTPPGLAKHWPALAEVQPVASASLRHKVALADRLREAGR